MDEKPPFILPERNPKTHAAHRKDVGWQITLPLVVGCLLLVLLMAGVVWTATGPSTDVSRWVDISLLWLILPALLVALPILGVLVGLVYLVSKLMGVLPGYARLVQDKYAILSSKVMRLSDAPVLPLLKLKGWSAAARKARQVATAPFKSGQPPQD